MVLLKHDPRKETTYGWYPSHQGSYDKYREKHHYEKECLFKYWDSLYHHNNRQTVSTPQRPSPTPVGSYKEYHNPSSSSSFRKPASAQHRTAHHSPCLSIAGTAILQEQKNKTASNMSPLTHAAKPPSIDGEKLFHSFKPSPKILQRPTSKVMYMTDASYRLPASNPSSLSQYMAHRISPIEQTPIPVPNHFARADNDDSDLEAILQELNMKQALNTRDMTSRTQSATITRVVGGATLSRRVQSAGPRSAAIGLKLPGSSSQPHSRAPSRPVSSVRPRSAEVCSTVKRPRERESQSEHGEGRLETVTDSLEGQVPHTQELATAHNEDVAKGEASHIEVLQELQEEEEEEEEEEAVNGGGDHVVIPPSPPPYESQLNQYGWHLEVHGNPLNIKKVTPRLPYTVQCAVPVVREDPPRMRIQDNRTFFSNTIPRRPATFTVHPEWASETFNKRKNAHIKATKKQYHTRHFGFVY